MYDRTHEPAGDALDELAEELIQLAGSAAPGRSIDITRAMRDGRVRLRRRRMVTVSTVAVAAAATMTVSLLASGAGGAQRPAVPAPPASAPNSADPLVVEASYGWLPAGYQVNYLPDHGRTVPRADGGIPEGGSTQPIIWLKVYPAGTTPPIGQPFYQGGPRQHRVEAAPVDGRPAYWVGEGPTTPWAPGGDIQLRWQSADGRWAEMDSSYLTGADASKTMHRIAEKVVVAHRAIPLPYRINGIPKAVKLSSADFDRSRSAVNKHVPWTSTISFTYDGMPITTTVRPGPAPSRTTSAGPDSYPEPKQTCTQAHGLSICTESQYGVNAYHAVGSPEAWLKKFTLLGTDERAWTTDVLH
jgi:hypothetical protein